MRKILRASIAVANVLFYFRNAGSIPGISDYFNEKPVRCRGDSFDVNITYSNYTNRCVTSIKIGDDIRRQFHGENIFLIGNR